MFPPPKRRDLGDLDPVVGIGRVVLVILAAWIVVLGLAAWWAFS